MFSVDFYRLVMQLLPTFFRQPVLFGILRAGLMPLIELYTSFTDARKQHNYRLTHNGQVCYLRAVLNDTFGGGFDILTVEQQGEWVYAITESGSNIRLTFGENGNTAYVEAGQKIPVLYSEAVLNIEQNNFIVQVPYNVYITQLANVAALVDKYKLISKRAIYVAVSQ